jgi:hypothetical protein
MIGLRREDGKIKLVRGLPATITVKEPETRRVLDAVIECIRNLNIFDTDSPDVLNKVGRRTEVVSVSPHLYVRERSNDIWEIGFNGNPPGNNAQTPLSASGGSSGGSVSGDIINHYHITINGRRVDVPSYLVRAGDVVRVKNRKPSLQLVHAALAEFRRDVPDFLSRSEGGVPEGRVDRLPVSDDVSIPVQANLIIELCSK